MAFWDYFWSHNWPTWSCYLPCFACGFSFDDRFWMETTRNPYDFWLKNWIFRSFLALWDYFWSHNWLTWSCYLPCLACGFSFDDRFWMETTHNPYDFWLKKWIFLVIFGTPRLFLVITDLCEVVILPVLPTIDSEWKRLTNPLWFLIKKLNFLGHFWHSETIFGVIDLREVVICLVFALASHLDDRFWMETTHIPYDFWLRNWIFRSFLALWDYFWSHNWLTWSCYLPCLACGFSFDDRFWMETTHIPYDFWLRNWIF